MCLRKVIDIYNPPLKDIKVGYKFFVRNAKNELSYWYADMHGKPKRYDWNEDLNKFRLKGCDSFYPTGYHIYDSLSAIGNFKFSIEREIYKVEYTDIIVKGMNLGMGSEGENSHLCFVARKFRILEKV